MATRKKAKPAKAKAKTKPKSKAASKKVVKLKSKKPAAKADDSPLYGQDATERSVFTEI